MKPYYQLLKEKFPTKADVLTEIINLNAITHLPKGTEHFVSDLHGEYDAFDYILRNASGAIKRKIQECFSDQLTEQEKENLAIFIYYPEEQLVALSERLTSEQVQIQTEQLLLQLLQLTHFIGSKYTRSKIRKMLPSSFSYIIEELLSEFEHTTNKEGYFQAIIDVLTRLQQLDNLIVKLAYLVQDLTVDHLHIVGDIFDRGPYPDKIIDRLMNFRSVDIQWGNHDVTWMGAIAGSTICMINVIRIAARYNNLELIEDSYGVNLRSLIDYSKKYYEPLPQFAPITDGQPIDKEEADLLNQLQQATAVLQFKLEEQLIQRRPEFNMEHRRVLRLIDYDKKEITLSSGTYSLVGFNDSQINPQNPGAFSDEEEKLVKGLMNRFQSSEKLQRQVAFLFDYGSMYLCYNDLLLFHGCIPLHPNKDFKSLRINGEQYAGKELLDYFERQIRQAYRKPTVQDDLATDIFWYLWVGENSSLFGKEAMTTFERYYITDKAAHKELKNAYYKLRNEADTCRMILAEFGLSEDCHIVNGHTPVQAKLGENPVKAEGKLLVIDGGFAKGYQKKTGLAGYTLVYHSYGLDLVAHQAFQGTDSVLAGEGEILSSERLVERLEERKLVQATNIGKHIAQEIIDLEYLFHHYEDLE